MSTFASSLRDMVATALRGTWDDTRRALGPVLEALAQNISNTKPDAEAYGRLVGDFNDLSGSLDEIMRKFTGNEVHGVIERLENDGPVTKRDLTLIRMWIVGDAEEYVRTENNFQDWCVELDRLKQEFLALQEKDMGLADVIHLKALLLDASKLVPSIIFYLEQQAKVKRFDDASQCLDAEQKKLLASILKSWTK